MAEKQVKIMKLKVDLQCDKCYRKVKKVFCKFPQIRDQIYDEKNDMVTIKVVCCSPEKLRDKICCEGGGSIKSIEIVELPKPKPPPPAPTPAPALAPAPASVLAPPPASASAPAEPEKPKSPPLAPPPDGPQKQDGAAAPPPATPAVKVLEPIPVSVLACPSPAASAGLFFKGGLGGPPSFYGRPIYDSCGRSRPCFVGCHCQHYSCEEDASVCTIT